MFVHHIFSQVGLGHGLKNPLAVGGRCASVGLCR